MSFVNQNIGKYPDNSHERCLFLLHALKDQDIGITSILSLPSTYRTIENLLTSLLILHGS